MASYFSQEKIEETKKRMPASVRNGMDILFAEIANAIAADSPDYSRPAMPASGVIRMASSAKHGETVTIGEDTYEFNTLGVPSAGRILVDLSTSAAVAAQGKLTITDVATSANTMTIGTKVYTFVPNGTATADGEIAIGEDLAGAKANIVAAINGVDGINTAHPGVIASEFAVNVCTLTAIVPGTAGNAIATTETFTAGTNVFDAVVLGTTRAGADATADQSSTALVAAVNTSGTELVTAKKISANEVLLVSDVPGAVSLALATTMTGSDNAVSAATLTGGAEKSQARTVPLAIEPTAAQVALGNIHIPLAFKPKTAHVNVHVTSTGVKKAWNGGIKISTEPDFISIDNSGNTDWAATDTVYVTIFE